MSFPISILYTLPNFITAGSGRVVLNIVQRLNRDKFAPAICVLQKGGRLDQEVEKLGIPFIEAAFTVPATPRYGLMGNAWRAAQVFKPYRFNLWHSFHYLDDYTEPVIARLAGARAWVFNKKNMAWNRRSWYLRTLLATRVIVRNKFMLENYFSNFLFRKKARLIPLGIDAQTFQPHVPPRLQLRNTFHIPPEAITITSISNLVPLKKHEVLIRALAQVPEGHLLLAGSPLDRIYTESLHQLASELNLTGRVHFLDKVDDVPALLAESDIFALPSLSEGLSSALLEAMACGKACVATDIPGSNEALEQNVNGLLVPVDETHPLAEALQKLAISPSLRAALGTAARATVLRRYTVDKEIESLEAFYEEALSAGRSWGMGR